MSDDLAAYYRRRAPEYESIYFRPEEQRLFELEEMARALRAWVAGRDVLEVATGTGWWTVHAAATAKSVTATDFVEETLAIAKLKPLEGVRFLFADAFKLDAVPGEFDAAVACFWLSHVPRAEIAAFLRGLHGRLKAGSRVFMADNVYIEGFGGEFTRSESSEDTYRVRQDQSGKSSRVLKNYFSEEELRGFLSEMQAVEVIMGERFWWLTYETPGA